MSHIRKYSVPVLTAIVILLAQIFSRTDFPITYATSANVCPEGNGWSNHQDPGMWVSSGVDGATNYCWKGGSPSNTLASGNNRCQWFFYQSNNPNDYPPQAPSDMRLCGLSHWSYYIPSASPSPHASICPCPSHTPKPSHLCSPTPSPSPTMTPSPNPSASPEVSPSPEPSSEPEVSPSPSPSPSAAASSTPAPSSNSSSSTSSSSSESPSSSSSEPQGEVLGAYAGTGIVEDSLFALASPIGGLMFTAGTLLYGQKNKKK